MARIAIGEPQLAPVQIDELNLDVVISYRGSDGKATQRLVTINRLDGHQRLDGTIVPKELRGYCHLRKMARTFRLDRIVAAADADGAVIADLGAWIERQLSGAEPSVATAAARRRALDDWNT